MNSKEILLTEKELQLARLRKEVEALRIVAPLLTEEGDVAAKFSAESMRAVNVIANKTA